MCERNARVLRRMLWSMILSHAGEPFFYLLVFGYGFGNFIPEVEGVRFIEWLYPGLALAAAAMSAGLECTYSAFTRMARQGTYLAVASTPVSIEEVAVGEALWGAILGTLSGLATVLATALLFRIDLSAGSMLTLAALSFLTGLLSASAALLFMSGARGYENFAVYFTLLLTPSVILSGAYFPQSVFPRPLALVASLLPLSQPVIAARSHGASAFFHAGVTILFAFLFLVFAVRRISRRIIV